MTMKLDEFLEERPWSKLLRVLGGVIILVIALVISFAIIGERARTKGIVKRAGEVLAAAVQGAMSELRITNSIFWNNTEAAGYYEIENHGDIYISYCDIRGDIQNQIIPKRVALNPEKRFNYQKIKMIL